MLQVICCPIMFLEPLPLIVKYEDNGNWTLLCDFENSSTNISFTRNDPDKTYNILMNLEQRFWYTAIPQLQLLSEYMVNISLVSLKAYKTVRNFHDGKYSVSEVSILKKPLNGKWSTVSQVYSFLVASHYH